MHSANEIGKRVSTITDIAVEVRRQLLLIVHYYATQVSSRLFDHTSVSDHDLRKTLDQMHNFELVEWLDEALLTFKTRMLWLHGEVEAGQDKRVDSRNRSNVHADGSLKLLQVCCDGESVSP